MNAFIALEGGEGAGKTTVQSAVADHLRNTGRCVTLTREPGGTPVGEAVRRLVLDVDASMDHRCEALLFAAARADHAEAVIRPALARGEWVVCDRYVDSSLAYQGAARGLPLSEVRQLSLWGTRNLLPDLTIVLDIDPAVGLRRAREANRMEAQPTAFHARVRQCFLALAQIDPEHHVVIDASAPLETVTAQAVAALRRLDPPR
jgi:dTMP kinase